MIQGMHRRGQLAPVLAAVVIICLALAACVSTDPGLTTGRSITADGGPDLLPNPTTPPVNTVARDPRNAEISFGPNRTPRSYDDYLASALADIQNFWRDAYPATYGSPYTDLAGGIYALYPDRSDTINVCDTQLTYDLVAGNARYFGCGDFIAWDDDQLLPELTSNLGDSAVATVLAHEFGHAIQMRAGVLDQDLPTVVTEQQADCFAGAWSAHAARGESDLITFSDVEVKAGLVAMVYVRDPLDPIAGEPVFREGGHGTAFDRVGAFQYGFLGGTTECAKLIDTPLPLVNIAFSGQEDIANQGNLPYGDIQSGVVTDLIRFWTAQFSSEQLTFSAPAVSAFDHDGPFPTCEGIADDAWAFNALFCAASNTVFYDDGLTRALYEKYGDFSVGYVLSNAWGEAVQRQLGSLLEGKQRALLNDCLTGVWTNDIVPNGSTDQPFTVSPGDLDEAVSTALVLDDVSQSGVLATAFEKIDSFRAGVLGGFTACDDRIKNG